MNYKFILTNYDLNYLANYRPIEWIPNKDFDTCILFIIPFVLFFLLIESKFTLYSSKLISVLII